MLNDQSKYIRSISAYSHHNRKENKNDILQESDDKQVTIPKLIKQLRSKIMRPPTQAAQLLHQSIKTSNYSKEFISTMADGMMENFRKGNGQNSQREIVDVIKGKLFYLQLGEQNTSLVPQSTSIDAALFAKMHGHTKQKHLRIRKKEEQYLQQISNPQITNVKVLNGSQRNFFKKEDGLLFHKRNKLTKLSCSLDTKVKENKELMQRNDYFKKASLRQLSYSPELKIRQKNYSSDLKIRSPKQIPEIIQCSFSPLTKKKSKYPSALRYLESIESQAPQTLPVEACQENAFCTEIEKFENKNSLLTNSPKQNKFSPIKRKFQEFSSTINNMSTLETERFETQQSLYQDELAYNEIKLLEELQGQSPPTHRKIKLRRMMNKKAETDCSLIMKSCSQLLEDTFSSPRQIILKKEFQSEKKTKKQNVDEWSVFSKSFNGIEKDKNNDTQSKEQQINPNVKLDESNYKEFFKLNDEEQQKQTIKEFKELDPILQVELKRNGVILDRFFKSQNVCLPLHTKKKQHKKFIKI